MLVVGTLWWRLRWCILFSRGCIAFRRCKGDRGRWGDGRIGCALTCGGLNDWLPGNNTNKGGEKEGMLTVILFSVYMYL